MSPPKEVLFGFWKEHREQMRQSETQRSTLTNFLLVITAGLSALIVQQKFSSAVIPLALFIAVLGLYGALTVAKYYERAEYHLMQARALASIMIELGYLSSDEELEERRSRHYQKFSTLHRIRLHHLWVALHVSVVLYGVVLLVICLVNI